MAMVSEQECVCLCVAVNEWMTAPFVHSFFHLPFP